MNRYCISTAGQKRHLSEWGGRKNKNILNSVIIYVQGVLFFTVYEMKDGCKDKEGKQSNKICLQMFDYENRSSRSHVISHGSKIHSAKKENWRKRCEAGGGQKKPPILDMLRLWGKKSKINIKRTFGPGRPCCPGGPDSPCGPCI